MTNQQQNNFLKSIDKIFANDRQETKGQNIMTLLGNGSTVFMPKKNISFKFLKN